MPFYFVSLVTPSGDFDDNGYKPQNIVLITTRSRSLLRFFVIFENNVEYRKKDKQKRVLNTFNARS